MIIHDGLTLIFIIMGMMVSYRAENRTPGKIGKKVRSAVRWNRQQPENLDILADDSGVKFLTGGARPVRKSPIDAPIHGHDRHPGNYGSHFYNYGKGRFLPLHRHR